jgi:prepilin-type N-terminal cleavage/methylation domain-containing protein
MPNKCRSGLNGVSGGHRGKSGGFTLIEVLIASIILFLFLAIASQSFGQAALSSRKAERSAKVAAMVPLLMENIRQHIVEAKTVDAQQGNGLLFEMGFKWKATLLERKQPPRRFDPDSGEIKDYDERFNLWQVEVTVTDEVNQDGNYSKTWRYKEISWHK